MYNLKGIVKKIKFSLKSSFSKTIIIVKENYIRW